MKKELDPRMAMGLVALVVVLVGALAWWKFGTGGGQLTAQQAGLGKPMKPGEIPGKQEAVPAPNANVPSNR